MVRIEIIIPTVGRPAALHTCLTAVAESMVVSGVTDVSVTVVLDGHDDDRGVPSALRHRVAVRASPVCQGAQAARQAAAEASDSDVLAFLDDDAVPRGDWLGVIAGLVCDQQPAITGRVLGHDTGLVARARQARYDQRYALSVGGRHVEFFAGGNSAITRRAFADAGGFRHTGLGGDNSICAGLHQQGAGVTFVPNLVVTHHNGKGLRAAARAAFLSGRESSSTGLREAARALRRPSPGHTCAERHLNTVLNSCHQLGRLRVRPPAVVGSAR